MRVCSRFLPVNMEFFSPVPVTVVLDLGGVQALGSVERLETIVLFWCYIIKMKCNYFQLQRQIFSINKPFKTII